MRVYTAAVSLALLATFALSSCSQWPGPEHRDVSMSAIESIVEAHCKPDVETRDTLNSLGAIIDVQATELQELTAAVETIKSTSPAPSRSVVPAPVCVTPPHSTASAAKTTLDDSKVVIGATEWIHLAPPGQYFRARVDTGAATSSISAKNVVRFERDGNRWVSFDLDTGEEAEPIHLEAPLVRNVRIRQASFDDIDRRAVVRFDVMLGESLRQPTDFTLADRTRMSYPVLLGRSFLKDMAIVDVSAKFLHPRLKDGKK